MENRKLLFLLTLFLCLVLVIGSTSGIFFEKELYSENVPAYTLQSLGTDAGNVFVIMPVLLVSAFLMLRGSKRSIFVWLGAMLYATYIIVYNCFTLHFNHLFLIYCALLVPSFLVYTVIMSLCLVALEIMAGVKGYGVSVPDIALFGLVASVSAVFSMNFIKYCAEA